MLIRSTGPHACVIRGQAGTPVQPVPNNAEARTWGNVVRTGGVRARVNDEPACPSIPDFSGQPASLHQVNPVNQAPA